MRGSPSPRRRRCLGIGRRQVFRLRQALVMAVSRKRGRRSNRRRGAAFRRTVLTLVRERSTPTCLPNGTGCVLALRRCGSGCR